MDPRNLKDSTANTVLLSMVRGSSAGGLLLKSTVISTVLRVFDDTVDQLTVKSMWVGEEPLS